MNVEQVKAGVVANLGSLMAGALCLSVVLGSPLAMAGELSDGVSSVSIEEVRKELEAAPPHIRAQMRKEQMSRFVANVLTDRRLAEAAKSAGTAELEVVKAQIAKSTREIIIKAFIEGETLKLSANLPDLEKLAKERYDVDKASYARPEAIRASHILLRVDEENPEKSDAKVQAKGEKLLAELKAGADFAVLAKANSEDSGSAIRNGELPGWQDKGRLVPPFETAAYALKPGEISGLVKSRFGYHIIKLHEHRPSVIPPFAELKDQIVSKLRTDLIAQKRNDLIKRYSGIKPVEIDDVTLEILRKN